MSFPAVALMEQKEDAVAVRPGEDEHVIIKQRESSLSRLRIWRIFYRHQTQVVKKIICRRWKVNKQGVTKATKSCPSSCLRFTELSIIAGRKTSVFQEILHLEHVDLSCRLKSSLVMRSIVIVIDGMTTRDHTIIIIIIMISDHATTDHLVCPKWKSDGYRKCLRHGGIELPTFDVNIWIQTDCLTLLSFFQMFTMLPSWLSDGSNHMPLYIHRGSLFSEDWCVYLSSSSLLHRFSFRMLFTFSLITSLFLTLKFSIKYLKFLFL